MNFIRRLRLPRKPTVKYIKCFNDVAAVTIIPHYDDVGAYVWMSTHTQHERRPIDTFSLIYHIGDISEMYPAGSVRFYFENPLSHTGFKREWAARSKMLSNAFGANRAHVVTDHTDFLDVPTFAGVTLRLNTAADLDKLDDARLKRYPALEYQLSPVAAAEARRRGIEL